MLDDAGLRGVLGRAAASELGTLVRDNARRVRQDRGVASSAPHDPLALLAAVRPDLVTTEVGPTGVDGDGRLTAEGPLRQRVVAISPEGVAETWRRIAAGASS
jgi:hypothetical protein